MSIPLTIKQRFVIDESGSMARMAHTVVSGFNEQVQTMKNEESEKGVRYLVSLIKFNSSATVVFRDLPLSEVPELTAENYRPNGFTALFDALGAAIDTAEVGETNVIVTVMTDGDDNTSREWNKNRIRTLVELRQRENKWGFIFFGANVDAWDEARSLGIGNAVNFTAQNTGAAMSAMSMCRSTYTSTAKSGDYDLFNLASDIKQEDLTR